MKVLRCVILGGLIFCTSSVWAQMHKVARPEQVVRAVGVYEWTGDMTKPTASRLIPVSVFIDGKLQDAGVYLSQPVPFALLSGDVYELQTAGIGKALLDLSFARHIQPEDAQGNTEWDDGWFGYGSVKLLAPKRVAALKPSKNTPVLMGSKGPVPPAGGTAAKSSGTSGNSSNTSDDPDRPTMKRRQGSTGDSGSTSGSGGNTPASSGTNGSGSTGSGSGTQTSSGNTPSDDPDRPVMKRRQGSESNDSAGSTGNSTANSGSTTANSGSSNGNGSSPADDPDRPTMKRRTSDNSSDNTGTTASTGSGGGTSPADDPDRPTLKRHTPADAKGAQSSGSSTMGSASLNDDPNRPRLHYGKPAGGVVTEDELPKLKGLPADARQIVAVSDAVDRDPHNFTLTWDSPAQRATVLSALQEMARTQLAAYAGAAPAPTPAASTTKKTTPAKTAAARAAAAKKKAAAAPMVMLMDEDLKGYRLSYGGAATYVYTAHTAGTGAALRYVTVVAQEDGLGALKPAIRSVTDAVHLDRTPRMKFVDVVDAEASNRASLLFELLGQSSRQFALYRVIAAHAEQTFATGTTE